MLLRLHLQRWGEKGSAKLYPSRNDMVYRIGDELPRRHRFLARGAKSLASSPPRKIAGCASSRWQCIPITAGRLHRVQKSRSRHQASCAKNDIASLYIATSPFPITPALTAPLRAYFRRYSLEGYSDTHLGVNAAVLIGGNPRVIMSYLAIRHTQSPFQKGDAVHRPFVFWK